MPLHDGALNLERRMDIGGLLSALNQSLESSTISQVAADGAAKAQPGTSGLSVSVSPVPGAPATGPGASVGLTVSGNAPPLGGLTFPAVPNAAGALPVLQGAPGAQAGPVFTMTTGMLTAAAPANTAGVPALTYTGVAPGTRGSADVYYGPGEPASPSLLSPSGVGAFIPLVNALAAHAGDEKSAEQLTNNLGNAAATLKSAYFDAASRLPAPLQAKDWGFSVFNGKLVFTAGADGLTPQDFADLQNAFAATGSEPA